MQSKSGALGAICSTTFSISSAVISVQRPALVGVEEVAWVRVTSKFTLLQGSCASRSSSAWSAVVAAFEQSGRSRNGFWTLLREGGHPTILKSSVSLLTSSTLSWRSCCFVVMIVRWKRWHTLSYTSRRWGSEPSLSLRARLLVSLESCSAFRH